MNKEPSLVTLKLKTGEDILGYYAGDSEEDTRSEKSMILFRPIKIRQVAYSIPGKKQPVFSYISDLYSLFGSSITSIPYSNILLKDIASDFFQMYYTRVIGELIAREEIIQETVAKAFIQQDEDEAMKNCPYPLIRMESAYLQ